MTRIALACIAALGTAACDSGPGAPDADASTAAPAVAAQPDERTMRMWARSCALCHVDGNGGAPRMGHAEEWAPRLAQGRDKLLEHTVAGLNQMPPLGYCMACERDDFLAMIDFMTAGLQPAQGGR